ncbi:HD domain-containing protein [Robiginitalea sp. IMCC43444]|uniref:HD domain-containing protein n=1 Tax=Robiginitalea sp. IMCC43444 TaxID=3459121 RepID=UPI004041A23A
MKQSSKLKIFNDPIYGFISIPSPLVFNLIAHPYFQRLRRISQMGLSYLVYPGAHHTRFHHALGAMHLMQQAISLLRRKGFEINQDEEEGLLCAILLHDIGHGPFSHALENEWVSGISHEAISLRFMEELNKEFSGRLDLAIAIFTGSYNKKYLNELVSSQLDMDRLDYLKRDSFYSGVAEGNINAERLITMLSVHEGRLVVEEKGIYSVEKYLLARRFMYWQVYLHKTGVVAEQLLIRVIQRARELGQSASLQSVSPALDFFLKQNPGKLEFTEEALKQYAELDDIDILASLKKWQKADDRVLAALCKMLLQRRLLSIKIKKAPISARSLQTKLEKCRAKTGMTESEAAYFVFEGVLHNRAYNQDNQNINIIKPNGKVIDVASASDHLNLEVLSQPVTKYYICYPKKGI